MLDPKQLHIEIVTRPTFDHFGSCDDVSTSNFLMRVRLRGVHVSILIVGNTVSLCLYPL